eukprot:2588677-Rhodomonas_salina.2
MTLSASQSAVSHLSRFATPPSAALLAPACSSSSSPLLLSGFLNQHHLTTGMLRLCASTHTHTRTHKACSDQEKTNQRYQIWGSPHDRQRKRSLAFEIEERT